MKTQTAVSNVRTFFRLFTTANSDLTFTATNYPTSSGASPIALLGRTPPAAEIISIPFFAEPRVETRAGVIGAASMTTQLDPANSQAFSVTPPGSETIRYFGSYLDINSDAPRYPAAPSGDGPFPVSECVSIRNILRGQHQCMVVEVYYPPDPTEPNSTPASSDHLAQRNLLILETANPGLDATHTVQHSFDVALPPWRIRDRVREEFARAQLASLRLEPRRRGVDSSTAFLPVSAAPIEFLAGRSEPLAGLGAWLEGGFDELTFFWNNLPRGSRVEVYLPSFDVEYVMLLRSLRHAPPTVRAVDEHTLSLDVDEVSYLPIPYTGQDRVAGVLTIALPDTIKVDEVYTIDVLQTRTPLGLTIGGFQIAIPVRKAAQIYRREGRILGTFEGRLRTTPTHDRWYQILTKQVEYFRAQAQALASEVADECAQEQDQKGFRLRLILERIKVLDAYGPLVHGSGEVSFVARVTSRDAGGIGQRTVLPATGSYHVHDQPGGYVIDINQRIFRGSVVENLVVEIVSAESEEQERGYRYHRVFAGKPATWVGSYRPSTEMRDPENVGDWQVWYRIEEG
jgi:hypothetical protein